MGGRKVIEEMKKERMKLKEDRYIHGGRIGELEGVAERAACFSEAMEEKCDDNSRNRSLVLLVSPPWGIPALLSRPLIRVSFVTKK